ncbi:hypothetical protein BGX38DRAFT_1163481 [Terfezia claveryi]|nr:hypothetical protein BGX38DRAFT_1163481 [Terfezia claveryi]
MEKKLFSHITQLAQRGIATGPCRCNEGSGIGGVNHDKRKGGMEQRGQKRNRDQSIEIPCSWNLENIIEVEGEDQKKREDEPEPEPEPEPELEPMPKPVPKRRRLMSDNEILEMELEEIKRIRATEVEGHGYSEGPGGFGEGYEGGFEEESMSEGRMIVEMEQGGDVSRVKTRAMAMAMKKRVLLTTQELLEEELLAAGYTESLFISFGLGYINALRFNISHLPYIEHLSSLHISITLNSLL